MAFPWLRQKKSFRNKISAHLRKDPTNLPIVTQQFAKYNHANVHLALGECVKTNGRTATILGLQGGFMNFTGAKLSELVAQDSVASLFTGARKANVLGMRWEQIDFDLAIWTIPLTKSGDSQTLPLPTFVLELLLARHKYLGSEWVFPGKGKTGHLVEPKMGWYNLLKAAEIEGLRIHDLRTLGSYMAMGNQSLHMIGKVLGHRSPTATQIYSRVAHDPIRQAMEKAQNDMLAAAGLVKAKKSKRS